MAKKAKRRKKQSVEDKIAATERKLYLLKYTTPEGIRLVQAEVRRKETEKVFHMLNDSNDSIFEAVADAARAHAERLRQNMVAQHPGPRKEWCRASARNYKILEGAARVAAIGQTVARAKLSRAQKGRATDG